MLGYYIEHGYKIAEIKFDKGVVGLDIDAPNKRFVDGNLHNVMVKQVGRLAGQLSEKYNLGRFWIYDTGSPGCHVIFEYKATRWASALYDAAKRKGWKECEGHHFQTAISGRCALRVGHKPSRNWDIFPWATNPIDDKPKHIIEHENLLALKLEAKAIRE